MSIIIKQAIWWQAAAYSPATSSEDFDPESPDNGMSSLELAAPAPGGSSDPAYYTSPTANIVAGKFCGSLRQFSLALADTDGDGTNDSVSDSATLGVRFGDPTLTDARVVFKPSAAEAIKIFGQPKPVVVIADFEGVRVPLSYMLMGVYNSGLSQECTDRSLPDSWFKHSNIPGDLVDPVSLDLLKQEMAPRVQTTSDGEDAGFFVKFPRQDDVTQIGCCGVIVEPPGSSTTSQTGQCSTGPTLRAYAGTPEKTRIWSVRAAVRGSIEAHLPPDAAAWTFTGPNPQELVYAEFDDESLLDSQINTASITWHHAGFVVLEDNHGAFFPGDFCGTSANDSSNLGNCYNYQKKLPIDIVDIAWDSRGWLWGMCTGPSRTEGADLDTAPETTVDGLYRILPGGWTYTRADAISFGGHFASEPPVTSRLVESRMGGGSLGFKKVSCGDGCTLYLTNDGKVEFVSSTSAPSQTPPADVLSPDATVIDIAASSTHAACIMTDGTLRVWAMDGSTGGWLQGDGSTGFLKVACGDGRTCAIKTDGDIQVWPTDVVPPPRTDPTKPFVQIDCGSDHVAGQTNDGDLFVSGSYSDGSVTLPVVGVSVFACGDDCTIYTTVAEPTVISYSGVAGGDIASPPDTNGQEVKFLAAGNVHAVALCRPVGSTGEYFAWTWGSSSATLTGVPLTYGTSPLSFDGQQQVFRAASCGKRHTCLITNGALLEPRYSPARLIYRSKISLASGVTVDDEPIAVVTSSPNTGVAISQPQRCDSSTIILGKSDYTGNPFDFTSRVGLKMYDPSERTVRIIAARWRPHRLAVGTGTTNQLSCASSITESKSHNILPSAAGLPEVDIPAGVMDWNVLERESSSGSVSYVESSPNGSYTVINGRTIVGNYINLPVRATSVQATSNSTIFSSYLPTPSFFYSSNPVGDSRPFLPGPTLLHTVAAHVLMRYDSTVNPDTADWAQVPSLLKYLNATFESGSGEVPYNGASVGREYLRPPTLGGLPAIEIKRTTSEWRLRCAIPEGDIVVSGTTSQDFTMNMPATLEDDPDTSGANFSSGVSDGQKGGDNIDLHTSAPALSQNESKFIAFDDFLLSLFPSRPAADSSGFWSFINNGTSVNLPNYSRATGVNCTAAVCDALVLLGVRFNFAESSNDWRAVDYTSINVLGNTFSSTPSSAPLRKVFGAAPVHTWDAGTDVKMKAIVFFQVGPANSANPVYLSHFSYKKPDSTGVWGLSLQPPLARNLSMYQIPTAPSATIDVLQNPSQQNETLWTGRVGKFGVIAPFWTRTTPTGAFGLKLVYFPRKPSQSIEGNEGDDPITTGFWVGLASHQILRPFVPHSDTAENFLLIDELLPIGSSDTRRVTWFYGENDLLQRGTSNFSQTYSNIFNGASSADFGSLTIGQGPNTADEGAPRVQVLGCIFSSRGDSQSKVVFVTNRAVYTKGRTELTFTRTDIDIGQSRPAFWPVLNQNQTAGATSMQQGDKAAMLHSQDGTTPLLLLMDLVNNDSRLIRVYKIRTDNPTGAQPVEYLGPLVLPSGFSLVDKTMSTTSDGRLIVGGADDFCIFDIVYNESSASTDPAELKSVRAVHYYPCPSRESINEDSNVSSSNGTPFLSYSGSSPARLYPSGAASLIQSATGEIIGTWGQYKSQTPSSQVISFENTSTGLRVYTGTSITAKISNSQIRSRCPGSPSLTSGGLYFSGQFMPMQAPWGNMWTNISVGTSSTPAGGEKVVLFVGDYFCFFQISGSIISSPSRHFVPAAEEFIWVTEFNARRAIVRRTSQGGGTQVTAQRSEAISGQLPYKRVKEKYLFSKTLGYPLGSGTPIKVTGASPSDQDLWVYWGRKIFKIGTNSNTPTVVSEFDIGAIGIGLERWFHSPIGDTTEGYSDYLDGYVTSAAGKDILVIANSRCRYESIENTPNLDPDRMEIAILGYANSTWNLVGNIILNSDAIPTEDRGSKFHPDSYLPQRLSVAVSGDGLLVCVAGHVWNVDDQGLPRNSRISIFAKKSTGYEYQTFIPNLSINPIINFASRMEIASEGGGNYRLNVYSPLDLDADAGVSVDLNSEYSPNNTINSYTINLQGVVASVLECNDLVAAGDVNFDNSAAANLNHWVASPSPAFDGVQSASWAGDLLAITTLNRLMMLKPDGSNWQMTGHKDRPYLFNDVDVIQANFSAYKGVFSCSNPACDVSAGTVKLPSPANGKQALDGRVRASFFVPNATTQPNLQGFYQIDNSAGTETGWFTAIKNDVQLATFSHFKIGEAIAETAKPSPGEPLFDPAVQGAIRQVALSGTTVGNMTTITGNSPCTVRRPLFAQIGGVNVINWPFVSALQIRPRYMLRSDEPNTLGASGISGLDLIDAGTAALSRNAQNILVLKDGMDRDSKGIVQPSLTSASWAAGSKMVTDGGQLVSLRFNNSGIIIRSFTDAGIFPESGGGQVATNSQRFGIKRPVAITVGGASACGAGAFDIARPSRSPFSPFEGRAGGTGASPWLLIFERHGFDAPYFNYANGDFGARTLSVANPADLVHADPFSVDPQAPFDPIGIVSRVGWCGNRAYPMGGNAETIAESMLRMLRGVFDPATGAVFNSDSIALATSDSLVGDAPPNTYQWSFPVPTGNFFSLQKCVCDSTPLDAFEWLRKITRRPYTPAAQECALRVLHGSGTDPNAGAPFFSRFQEGGVRLKSLVFVLTCNETLGDESVNGTPMASLDENTLNLWAEAIVTNLTQAGIFGAQSSVHFVDMVKRTTGSPYRRACEMLAEVSGGSYISLGRPWPSPGAT